MLVMLVRNLIECTCFQHFTVGFRRVGFSLCGLVCDDPTADHIFELNIVLIVFPDLVTAFLVPPFSFHEELVAVGPFQVAVSGVLAIRQVPRAQCHKSGRGPVEVADFLP